ncbi:endonuclease III [Adhaeretor mobilis]|uniref:Endonuclease III n=1 Tax=Adhaeretor mobilis TaxID=1930276 RepID=A0A517MUM2_9BACT|nr:endonuclease III [Adhaeretor mobilis]QDS98562.1 Ultraviolet N-glycosylase/AP lyase [Adhaeretor mobilis]
MAKSKTAKRPKNTGTPPFADADSLKKQASSVLRRLKADYPDAHCALDYDSPFQLLIATILSAQCTDKRVNLVTKDLFQQFPEPEDFAAAPVKKIEKAVQSTGFFRNKAKNIKSCCADLVEKHGGEIPQDLASLTQLAGVGRKTANVVLGTGFGLATGVVVDTHVGRISRRTGLTTNTDAVKVERDLMPLIPKRRWVQFSHQMIDHGRAICDARKPKCDECSMKKFCPQIDVG